jgi:hypothetical protein
MRVAVALLLVLAGCDDARRRSDPDTAEAGTLPPGTPPLVDAAPRPDAGARDVGVPDAALAECVVTYTLGGGEMTCALETDAACESLAKCTCEALRALGDVPELDPAACADNLLLPRGAITLSDFCFSGEWTIGQVLEDLSWLDWRRDMTLSGSAGCQELLAR